MRRLLTSLALAVVVALALAACVPALTPVPERDGENVIITLAPTQDLYSVTLSVLNATTDDVRCAVIAETDVGCALGDLPADSETVVIVTGDIGTVRCSAFGFTDPN